MTPEKSFGLYYKKIFLKKRNFFDGSGWTDQWKRAILLE